MRGSYDGGQRGSATAGIAVLRAGPAGLTRGVPACPPGGRRVSPRRRRRVSRERVREEIWELSEEESIRLATDELARIGLVDPSKVVDGARVHVPRAYPMYDAGYEAALDVIRPYLAQFENLETCGRNGLHRYSSQDHAMWTAALPTLNLLDDAGQDVWWVNTDDAYLEDARAVLAVEESIELVA